MCEEPQFTHINILELRAERQKLNNSKVNDLLMGDTLTKKILEKAQTNFAKAKRQRQRHFTQQDI